MNKETKEFIERAKRLELPCAFLSPEGFIDLLNAGASIINLDIPLDVCEGVLYKQIAIYQGVPIETNTENKIYDI